MIVLYHLLVGSVGVLLLRRLRQCPSFRRSLLLSLQALLVAVVISWGTAELIGHSRFALFRLLGLLLFVHTPVVLAVVAWQKRGRGPLPWALVLVAAGLVGVATDAYWIEPHWLEISRVEIVTPKIEEPLRIALLADLQTDFVGDYEREVLEAAVFAEPDLILLPGDYLQIYDRELRRVAVDKLRRLLLEVGFSAPMGAFALTGDMEGEHWREPFAGTEVTTLAQRAVLDLGDLVVTALPAELSHDASLVVGPQKGFHVVVGHAPDFALGSIEADLLLAGHTHGGQVRLPWIGPLITFSRVPRDWAAGVTDLGAGRTLIVSRGIGMERGHAPRVRFLCRPELVLIDLKPDP